MRAIGQGSVTYGRRLTDLSEQIGEKTAVVFVSESGTETSTSWRELEAHANRAARCLAERGAGPGTMVIVGLPNCIEHLVACFAAWKLGACVLPLSSRLPANERTRLIRNAEPAAIVADWGEGEHIDRVALKASDQDESPLPDIVAVPGKAIASGGSTGSPKIIVDPRPQVAVPGITDDVITLLTGMRAAHVQLVTAPLYHNGPFLACYYGLFHGHKVVLMERFDAREALALIERHRVQWLYAVPTMMRRMWSCAAFETVDLTSLDGLYHTAAACPPSLKRAWIKRIGGERVFEGYGATEEIGLCAIRGDEWLEHPGSVGRPLDTEVRIVDDAGRPCAPGEVGEIFMRRLSGAVTYRYLGDELARTTEDGLASVGDLGYLDGDGYLYLADRRVDLIITGGSNVYPAEVEAVLLEHSEIADVAVIGLPDEDWGHRVHAIVQARVTDNPPPAEVLEVHCRERLVPYKVPKAYEFVDKLPRDEAGKIRRSLLVQERSLA